jgi:hypothetical protein
MKRRQRRGRIVCGAHKTRRCGGRRMHAPVTGQIHHYVSITLPFSRTYRFIPWDSACLVPASTRAVAPPSHERWPGLPSPQAFSLSEELPASDTRGIARVRPLAWDALGSRTSTRQGHTWTCGQSTTQPPHNARGLRPEGLPRADAIRHDGYYFPPFPVDW